MSKIPGDKSLTRPWGDAAGRSKRKEIKLTPEENAKFTEHADKMNRSFSDWARFSMEQMMMFDKLLYEEFPPMIKEAMSEVLSGAEIATKEDNDLMKTHPAIQAEYEMMLKKTLTEYAIIISLLSAADGFAPALDLVQETRKVLDRFQLEFDEMIFRDRLIVLKETRHISLVEVGDELECHLRIVKQLLEKLEDQDQNQKEPQSQ